MSIAAGNLFAEVPSASASELVTELLSAPNVTIQRIVSHGQASPPDFWYDQAGPEWVIVVAGAAAIQFEGETEPRPLNAGDYVTIPAHTRHRVAWTDAQQPTIWLAVHYR